MQRLGKLLFGFFGIIFLTAGSVLIFSGLPRERRIICRRTEDQTINCQFKQTIAGLTTREANLERLRSAEVASAIRADADHDFTIFQVNLIFADTVEIFDSLTQSDAAELKSKVDDFIAAPNRQSLALGNGYQSWLQILIGSAAIIFVMLIIISGIKRPLKKNN